MDTIPVTPRGNPFDPYRIVATLLNEVEAQVNGNVLDVSKMRLQSVAVTGTFVGTVQLEGTADDVTFFQIGSNITSASLITSIPYVKGIRAKVSAYTSGKITVKYMGRA